MTYPVGTPLVIVGGTCPPGEDIEIAAGYYHYLKVGTRVVVEIVTSNSREHDYLVRPAEHDPNQWTDNRNASDDLTQFVRDQDVAPVVPPLNTLQDIESFLGDAGEVLSLSGAGLLCVAEAGWRGDTDGSGLDDDYEPVPGYDPVTGYPL